MSRLTLAGQGVRGLLPFFLALILLLALHISPSVQGEETFQWVFFEQGQKVAFSEPLKFEDGKCAETMSLKIRFKNVEANYSIYLKLFPIEERNSVYLHDGWTVDVWLDGPFSEHVSSIGFLGIDDGTPTPRVPVETEGIYTLNIRVCPGGDAEEDTSYQVGLILALHFIEKDNAPGGTYNWSEGIWLTYTLEEADVPFQWWLVVIFALTLTASSLIVLIHSRQKKKKEEVESEEPSP